jgi:hypothetical protein
MKIVILLENMILRLKKLNLGIDLSLLPFLLVTSQKETFQKALGNFASMTATARIQQPFS